MPPLLAPKSPQVTLAGQASAAALIWENFLGPHLRMVAAPVVCGNARAFGVNAG
jgi:hypothetical protein